MGPGEPRAERTRSVWMRGRLLLLLCGVFGGLLAALADLVQKEHASAVLKLAATSNTHLGLPLPRWAVLLFIAIVAGLVSIIFEADTMQKSFTRGLGILSVVMTAVPYSSPPTTISFLDASPAQISISEIITGTAFAQEAKDQAGERNPVVPIVLRLTSDKPAPDVAKVTVTVEKKAHPGTIAQQMVYRKDSADAGESHLIRQIPFSLPPGEYVLKIEASGHRIARRDLTVGPGGQVAVNVAMTSTAVPLFLQRLGEK